jgi:hypothetical protein
VASRVESKQFGLEIRVLSNCPVARFYCGSRSLPGAMFGLIDQIRNRSSSYLDVMDSSKIVSVGVETRRFNNRLYSAISSVGFLRLNNDVAY